jgi:hypothetical protein
MMHDITSKTDGGGERGIMKNEIELVYRGERTGKFLFLIIRSSGRRWVATKEQGGQAEGKYVAR